jgi:hypothetical protein
MKLRQCLYFFHAATLVLAALLSPATNSWAQKAAAPIQPNPLAPVLDMPVPLGIQRGAALDLTLTGKNLAEPTGLWTSFPAKVTIPTDNNNGKDNAKLRVHLEVSKDAPLGFHTLALATTRGMSNFRLFCIDDLPQLMEVDSNRNKATPQPVPVPCVVVGRADAEINDYFKITVKAGQRVSFEVLGRRLGSAFDPQITLYDPRTGRELPGAHSNDAPGLQTDPRLTYVFKEAGDYVLEVRDVMYRGGADYWYRLRIGDFPCATAPIPMAARRGSQVQVQFAGPMVEGVAPVEVAVPTDPLIDTLWIAPKGPNGLYGWPVALAVSDHEEAVEQEPNNEPARANRIAVPGGITGRFLEPGDVDHYVFTAKKGQRYTIEAHTLELYSPTEVYMVLKDAKGAQVAALNPAALPRIDFTAPADGDYTLVVEHLLHWGGPAEAYRLTVTPYEPGFDLSLGLDRFDVPAGAALPLPILATRRDYTGPIEVDVVGHPSISGHVTINPAQPPPQPANQPAQPAATLFLSASASTPVGPYTITLRGSATINGKTVIHYVNLRTVVSQNLAGLSYPPRNLLSQVGLAVTEKPPFTLVAKLDQAEGIRGSPVPLTVTATRVPGFGEEIVLSAVGLPANVAPALKNIPKGENETKVQLNPAANAPLGQFPISIAGKAKYQNKDFSVTSQPVSLVLALPFDLRVEQVPLKLTPGGKAAVKVVANRKGGYQGPIAVELRNLPPTVTASKATIAMGQATVDIDLTAAANAVAIDKTDINVLGTATAAANQQNASPNFTVSVQVPPFDLKAEPTPLKLLPGAKTKVKVTATRKGYQGPITVTLRNLPASVTAAAGTIAMGQTAVEIEVTAAANAAVGDKADVNVSGIATAAGNQEIVSPNITVSIQKK